MPNPANSFQPGTGARIAALRAQVRRRYGQLVQLGGGTYPARIRALTAGEQSDLAEGVGVNAANADLRQVSLSQSAFGKAAMPREEGLIAWDEGSGLQSFTIIKVRAVVAAGVPVSLVLTVYRTPPSDITTTETTAEAVAAGRPSDAGQRKNYIPPKPPV